MLVSGLKTSSHHPVACSRVAIGRQHDSQTRISGAAYFAVISQIAMSGGHFNLFVNKGLILVILSERANLSMPFHPFGFNIDVGITFSAEPNLRAYHGILKWTRMKSLLDSGSMGHPYKEPGLKDLISPQCEQTNVKNAVLLHGDGMKTPQH